MRKKPQNKRLTAVIAIVTLILAICKLLGFPSDESPNHDNSFDFSLDEYSWDEDLLERPFAVSDDLLTPPPLYSISLLKHYDEDYVTLNGNKPFFDTNDLLPNVFLHLSELDELGRSGMAIACVGQETVNKNERESAYGINPSGWQSVKYDSVEGGYLYNRCHLIGYQLAGVSIKLRNLITGTRYFNVSGMLQFENIVAYNIEKHKVHVIYRVTPVYSGNELIARGVVMEAFSIEDSGKSVCFCVYVHNFQPGIEIDYSTGDSREAGYDDGGLSAAA